jgi:hypothetical protein
MKLASGSCKPPRSWQYAPERTASAGQTTAASDFENLVRRFIAYKPRHQFKLLSARLKAHQLRMTRQAA